MSADQAEGAARIHELDREDARRFKRIDELTRAGWTLRYDPVRDEYVMTRHEARARTLDAVIDAAESCG